ncbi:FAD/NAD-binding domain-containing protein [Fomitiporia mediterranea MF3/22]|uniref:FAD/NAD-binding domain-containing protein n=1 Tax=Fomitiporia mediterranea (strain MF3/22) TaxID=694068 RepID=UPI00044075BE|nr:FAD/NAD-binding domain-containing protein [Fomitiporia mediterranea MF3/22]EJC99653.1 FAD/NAD-binding domain-containing protein [Fomitiporia mediterranea MF3/22]
MITSHPFASSSITANRASADCLALDIIVVGAGVAGLSCAYTLRQAGHNVLVLEAGSGREEVGSFLLIVRSSGGIRIPPNMSRILLQWGLGPDLDRKTFGRCPKILFHSGHFGDAIGELLFHEKVMKELEAEVYLLHHSDLLDMLYKLASDAGAQFRFGAYVVDVDPKTPSVTLSTEDRLEADLIIGADGYQSITRSVLQHTVKKDDNNFASYMFTVPTELFKDDDELLQLVKKPTWNIWMGSNWAMLGHAVRRSSDFAVTLFRKEGDATEQLDWRRRIPVQDLDIEQFKFAPIPKRLITLATSTVRIKVPRIASLQFWYDKKGHVVVVGDAAHNLNPGSSHSAALAVEDAVVLGKLLSKARAKSETKRFLSAFQEIRQKRCEAVRSSEQQKVAFAAMPPGPLRDARDQEMQFQMRGGHMDWADSEESYLRKSWEEFRDVFGYDAFDDADTWWVEWGVLFERVNTRKQLNGDLFNGQVIVEHSRYLSG